MFCLKLQMIFVIPSVLKSTSVLIVNNLFFFLLFLSSSSDWSAFFIIRSLIWLFCWSYVCSRNQISYIDGLYSIFFVVSSFISFFFSTFSNRLIDFLFYITYRNTCSLSLDVRMRILGKLWGKMSYYGLLGKFVAVISY